MAFYSDINLQNKMSINFSDYAETIIAEDMETFGISSFSGFVNEVFKNFHDEAKSSENLYLENKQQELTGFKNLLIGSTKLKKEDISAVIYVMLEEEHTKIINMIMDLKAKYGQRNRIIYISKENEKYLFETCEEDEDSIVYSKPGQYFKCVIEEYVMLPFRERERIFKKEVFDILENACNEKKQLRITIPINGNMTKFYVYPYKIMTDVLGTRSYLACYTCKSSEEKKIASFAIHRLKADNIKTGSKNVHLTKREISSLESEIKKRTIAFLLDTEQEIHVRLTENGKRTYHNKLTSRPLKDTEKSTDDMYVFNCTEQQAYIYFYNFGADAEVISPQSLRNRLKNAYKKAYESYN